MRSSILTCLIILVLCFGIFGSSSAESPGSYTLTVENRSSVDITRMYVAWSKSGRWGPDVLGKGLLKARKNWPISLAPGEYDLMLIDSRNRSCVGRAIAVYSDRPWAFDDEWLSKCPQ